MIRRLKDIVEKNCISKEGNPTTLVYWSEVIFAKSVFALIPFSMLAFIPAVIVCLQGGFYLILGFDLFVFLMLTLVGYAPGISVVVRKKILVFLIFLAAFVLLMELGSYGPGLVYLLAATVFMLLLFPDKNPKIPFALTLLFCVIYGLLIHFNWIKSLPDESNPVMGWIAVSSNVVFLSAILTLLIPFFFSKLETTIHEKLQLVESLRLTNHELEKSIAEVKTKNSVLEEFAFVASHDLQEPIRMVHSFLKKLESKYKNELDQKAHQYIQYAVDGANRMNKIIHDLLDYSIAGGSGNPDEEVDLQAMMQEFYLSRQQFIEEKSISIESFSMPVILAKKSALIQTFYCLLDNALTFSKPDTPLHIEVKAEKKSSEWVFSIKDDGIGIDQQFFDKIFVIFQRLHNRDQYSGTGIGLSIAKKNIESWGGKIWLESTPGKGSTFFFTLPIL